MNYMINILQGGQSQQLTSGPVQVTTGICAEPTVTVFFEHDQYRKCTTISYAYASCKW